MTLPTSGPVTFTDIQTEFGGSNPIALNEYYAGGTYVPAGTSGTYGAVPSSGQISVQNFYGTTAFTPVYIEEVLSTWLYTGNGSTQTITNGIDLSGKGGMVWFKGRSAATLPLVQDTVRGATSILFTDRVNAASTATDRITSFNSDGVSIGSSSNLNSNGTTYVAWTFREQPKFFDIVTYTGNGTDGRTIAHNLGSVPGCIIVKTTNTTNEWAVYHRSLGATKYMWLNDTTPEDISAGYWYDTTPTSSVFTVGSGGRTNGTGNTYVAYLFAHNAGGFGAAGTDNVISCGSYTEGAAGTEQTINLGYEAQWLLIKPTSTAGSWYMYDTMRGFSQTANRYLTANTSGTEAFTNSYLFKPAATGFIAPGDLFTPGTNVIYIAIRRGPMKVPTVGTTVFTPATRTGTGSAATITSAGFPIDLIFSGDRNTARGFGWDDRLSGAKQSLRSWDTAGYTSDTEGVTGFDSMTGMSLGNGSTFGGSYNVSGETYVYEMLRRAPSFFDVVCYTGTGSAQNVTHNLTVAPELVIIKSRSNGGSGYSWVVGSSSLPSWGRYLQLNATDAVNGSNNAGPFNNTAPTSSVLTVNTWTETNGSGATYVAYLFATCAGVSKVGSYTGTGALQTVNCGFTSGARFVFIKRTDSTGGWYTYDSARGITSGNDPYLFLNNYDAEVTSTNYVDTDTTGFKVTAAAPAGLNASGGTYLFLAIA